MQSACQTFVRSWDKLQQDRPQSSKRERINQFIHVDQLLVDRQFHMAKTIRLKRKYDPSDRSAPRYRVTLFLPAGMYPRGTFCTPNGSGCLPGHYGIPDLCDERWQTGGLERIWQRRFYAGHWCCRRAGREDLHMDGLRDRSQVIHTRIKSRLTLQGANPSTDRQPDNVHCWTAMRLRNGMKPS